MNKLLIFFNILLLLIVIVGGVYFVMSSRQAPNIESDNIGVREEEDGVVQGELPQIDESTSLEEAQALVREFYENENQRVIGAVVDTIDESVITVKTYRAGEGTESIVEIKRIAYTNNTPIYESVIDTENPTEGEQVTRVDISSINVGDRIYVEAAEGADMRGKNKLTAVLIIKEVLKTPEPVLDIE